LSEQYLPLIEELGIESGSRSGDELYTRCPLHDDAGPSFAVNLDSGLWICHGGCGQGSITTLVGLVLGLDPLRAKSYIVNWDKGHPLDIDTERLRERLAPRLYAAVGTEDPVHHLDIDGMTQARLPKWWIMRGFDRDDWKAWDLWMGPTGGILIPVYDHKGILRGDIKRQPPEAMGPKYLYSAGFSKSHVLYGANRHDPIETGEPLVLVEGSLDAMWCWKRGRKAFAILGSHVSERQTEIIRQFRPASITLAFDNDKAGREATQEGIARLSGVAPVKAVQWTGDFASVNDVQELKDADALIELLDSATSPLAQALTKSGD